MNKIAWSAL